MVKYSGVLEGIVPPSSRVTKLVQVIAEVVWRKKMYQLYRVLNVYIVVWHFQDHISVWFCQSFSACFSFAFEDNVL